MFDSWSGQELVSKKYVLLLVALLGIIALLIPGGLAATTEIHIVKYANDMSTILAEKTLTYKEMRDTLPVQGDGTTHYYHQGPVFVNDPDDTNEQALRWNPSEDTNVLEKDMGAVKGTDIRDLIGLVGGMDNGDSLVIQSSDGMTKEIAYANIYSPSSRQGPAVITWYCSGIASCPGTYPDAGYSDGMRLVFFADDSVNPWGKHVFGNYDWHESADPKYWYYYMSGSEKYPTTTGLSVKYISEIRIYSSKPPGSSVTESSGASIILPASGSPPPVNPDVYGNKGHAMATYKTGLMNGSLAFFSGTGDRSVPANNRNREFNISVDIPAGSEIKLARLYIYTSDSYNLQTRKGIVPSFFAALEDTRLEEDAMYLDTDGDDNRHVATTYAYDVRDLIRKKGNYRIFIRNLDHEQTIFMIDGVLLVTAFENQTALATSYWIDEGCDIISSDPKKGLFPDDCDTSYPFPGTVNMTGAGNTVLSLVTTGLDSVNTTEHTVSFNKGVWPNALDKGNATIILDIPVDRYVNETDNRAIIESSIRLHDSDHLVNRNAFLVIKSKETDPIIFPANASIPEWGLPSLPAETEHPSLQSTPNGTASITFQSDPFGALIYVDGRYLGKTTPSTLDFERGISHTVRFERNGYSPSETNLTVINSSSVWISLYSPVYFQKGRLPEIPYDPDGIQHGGVYICSHPNGAKITIDGVRTGKTTPAIIMGLEPGNHRVNLDWEVRKGDTDSSNEFFFEEGAVFIQPGILSFLEINGIGDVPLYYTIIDSYELRGVPFTVNGYMVNTTIPTRTKVAQFGSFITIHDNGSYVSYPIPVTLDDDRYFPLSPKTCQNLELFIDSEPKGADVFIDGFRTGYSTPVEISNVSEGPHRIIITKAGYIPQQRLIDLPRRSTPVSRTRIGFILEEYPSGFLYITSDPQGGKISIDGISTGEVTPALFPSVPIGKHAVEVTGRNTTKSFPDVTITSVESTNINADFSPFREPEYSSLLYLKTTNTT